MHNGDKEAKVEEIQVGMNYTKEEWGEFEQEQFKLYAQKNKISLEEEKTKKGGKFFLDEKESDF